MPRPCGQLQSRSISGQMPTPGYAHRTAAAVPAHHSEMARKRADERAWPSRHMAGAPAAHPRCPCWSARTACGRSARPGRMRGSLRSRPPARAAGCSAPPSASASCPSSAPARGPASRRQRAPRPPARPHAAAAARPHACTPPPSALRPPTKLGDWPLSRIDARWSLHARCKAAATQLCAAHGPQVPNHERAPCGACRAAAGKAQRAA